MLDRTAKRILKTFIKLAKESGKGTEYFCAFDIVHSSRCDLIIDDFAESLEMRTEDVRAAIRHLESAGYIEYQHISGRQLAVAFHLSHSGLHYHEIRFLADVEFIRNSVIAPIIVSIITSILTVNWTSVTTTICSWLGLTP